jgi:hypothetical protein
VIRLPTAFYVNAGQAITEVGVFARASWNDGNNEILSFTDIDRSLSGSVSIMGGSWGMTFDYQFIANPGYNADRGPVSLFAARLHGEF